MDDYRIVIDPQEEDESEISGVYIKVLRIANEKANPEDIKYDTVLEAFATPFSIKDNSESTTTIKLIEVIGNLKLNQVDYDLPPNDPDSNKYQVPQIAGKKEVYTTVSRGYSLNIPQIGNILITHNGDVILKILSSDKPNTLNKSLHIETPKQVILNLTYAAYLNLDIVASTICISRGDKAFLNSLNFRPYSVTDITKGLFIDVNCLLTVKSLKLQNSLLMVLGQFSIISECKIDGGYIINNGEIKMSGRNNIVENISYFFNGSEAKFLPYSISMETNGFSNLGIIRSDYMDIKTVKAFDNQGTIEVDESLKLSGKGEALNGGLIKCENATVTIENKTFLHKAGEISCKTIKFLSKTTQIESQILGDEACFSNVTIIKDCEEDRGLNRPVIDVRKAVISGTFSNECFIRMNETLHLTGNEQTELLNSSLIQAQHIVSDASRASIIGGEVEAVKLTVNNGLLGTRSTMKKLEKVEVDFNGKLFFPKEDNNVSNLKEISNKGELVIQSRVSLVKMIENDRKATLQIEGPFEFDKLTSFSKISGKTTFLTKVRFSKVKELVLPTGAEMHFCKGSILSDVETLITQEDSKLILDEGTFRASGLMNIFNFGYFACPTQLCGMNSIYNGPKGKLEFYNEVTVNGCNIDNLEKLSKLIKNYSEIIRNYKNMISNSQKQQKFGVFNEGQILIKSPKIEKAKWSCLLGDIKSFFQCVPNDIDINGRPTFYERKGMRIYSNYAASKEALLQLDDYTIISAYDFINFGKIISLEKMRIDVVSPICRIGTVICEDGIDLNTNIDSFVFDQSFYPFMRKSNKKLNINNTNGIIEINDNHNYDVHLNIEARKFILKGKFIARSLDIKTTEFYIEKDEFEKNEISLKENFNIVTNFFMNHGGIIRSQDNDKQSKIVVNYLLQNTGAGEFTNDHRTVTYFDYNNKRSDIPHLDKAGLISTGGFLLIKTGTFDNCFGIVNGISGLNIESGIILNNECGLILSSGMTSIKGLNLDNGHYFPEFNTSKIFDQRLSSILPKYFIMRPRNGYSYSDTSYTTLTVVQQQTRFRNSTPSLFPGYIFSHGDLNIDMTCPSYIGTLVSERNIYFKGQQIRYRSSNELGTLIAGGNIEAEFRNARLEQFNIQARNILLKMYENLQMNGVIRSFMIQGKQINLIDLAKFGEWLGYLTPQGKFLMQGDTRIGAGGIVPIFFNPSEKSPIHNIISTEEVGFISKKPSSKMFIPSIDNSILHQLIRLTLTPLAGRDILLRLDIINELNKSGLNLLGAFTNSREIVLKDGNPALVYEELKDQEAEIEINGEKLLVPICNPYLIINTITRIMSRIQAEESVTLHTTGNINIRPGKVMDIQTHDLHLEAEQQMTIESEYKYTGNRSFNSVNYHFPGSLTLSGDKGVNLRAANISAGKKLSIKSKNGNIIDFDMQLDPIYNYTRHSKRSSTSTIHRDSVSSHLSGGESVELSAPNGSIKQHGTNIRAGLGGVNIEANSYILEPSYTYDYYSHTEKKKYCSMSTHTPKQCGFFSKGSVNFVTKNATLIGATIVAPTLQSETNGNFRLLPAFMDQNIYSRQKKSHFFGSTTVTFQQNRKVPIGSKILVKNFKMLGTGELEMVGVTAKIINATIHKSIKERAAYEESKTVITQRSSGFCPPKINGDCFVNAIKNMTHSMTSFVDAASATLGFIGSTCQTIENIKVLSNLSTIPNPALAITNILLSRFVSNFSFVNTKTVTTVNEKKPLQSQLNIEVLRVSNDRTYLEGIWNIKDKATFETKDFTTKAPEHYLHTHSKTTGYSISLSPVAALTACISPTVLSLGATLPSIGVFSSEKDQILKENVPQILTADDLFIRCDNAVFSGSKIQARFIECIVSNDLKIEDIQREFYSTENSSNFNVSLSGIFSLVKSMQAKNDSLVKMREIAKKAAFKSGFIKDVLTDTKFCNPALKAIPQMRFAEEKTIERSVQNLASFIGKEKFFLHVTNLLHMKNAIIGIVEPDGIVANSEKEKIEAGRILNEKIKETYHHEKPVFNPCVSEFVSMMSSYQSMQKTIEDIELRNYEKALKENKTVRQAKLDAKIQTKIVLNEIDLATKDQLIGLILIFKTYDEQMSQNKSNNLSSNNLFDQESVDLNENYNDVDDFFNIQNNNDDDNDKSTDQQQKLEKDEADKENTKKQALLIMQKLSIGNLEVQHLVNLLNYIKSLMNKSDKDCPFFKEKTLEEAIINLSLEKSVDNSSDKKHFENWHDFVLYKIFGGIAWFGEKIIENKELIDKCQNILEMISTVIQYCNISNNLTKGILSFIKGKTVDFAIKSFKNVCEEFLHNIFNFVQKATKDEDVKEQIIRAGNALSAIFDLLFDCGVTIFGLRSNINEFHKLTNPMPNIVQMPNNQNKRHNYDEIKKEEILSQSNIETKTTNSSPYPKTRTLPSTYRPHEPKAYTERAKRNELEKYQPYKEIIDPQIEDLPFVDMKTDPVIFKVDVPKNVLKETKIIPAKKSSNIVDAQPKNLFDSLKQTGPNSSLKGANNSLQNSSVYTQPGPDRSKMTFKEKIAFYNSSNKDNPK